jgi:hypothetical protein
VAFAPTVTGSGIIAGVRISRLARRLSSGRTMILGKRSSV